MRKLIINGHIADIDDNEVIALTKESNELFDFQNKRTNLSNKIKLPFSSKNHQIFGLANEPTSILKYDAVNRRNFCDVSFIQDYTEVIRQGKGKLVAANNHYELVIYWGNINIKEILGDDTLQDLTLNDLDHNFTLDAAINRDDDLCYPLVNFQEKGTVNSGTNVDKIDVKYLVPAVKLDRILKQITKDYHLFFEGIDDFDSNELWIPVNTRFPTLLIHETMEKELRDYLVGNFYVGGLETGEAKYALPLNNQHEFEVTETGIYKVSFSFSFFWEIEYLVPEDERFIAKAKVVAFAEIYSNGSWQTYNTYDEAVAGIQDGDTVGDYYQRNYNWGGRGEPRRTIATSTLNSESFVNLQENDIIRWRLIFKLEDESTENVGSDISIYQYSTNEFMVGSEEIQENFPYRMAQNLPDVKLIDILKYIAASTGSLIEISDNSRTIKFIQLRSFFENTHNAYDLSNKIESIEIESFHPEGLGRVNTLKYDNDEKIPNNHGKGVFKIKNDTLSPSNEFYTAPFSATINQSWNNYSIAHIPMLDEDNEVIDVGARLIGSTIINQNMDWKLDETIGWSGQKRIGRWNMNFQKIIDAYYPPYIRTMNDYKGLKAISNLSVKEFNDIDIMQPVKIKRYGYFMINKIHNFVAGQKTTMYLTMLAFPAEPVIYEPILPPPPPPPIYATLHLEVEANGRVEVNNVIYDSGNYSVYVEIDTVAQIKALPSTGYYFHGWTGEVTSTDLTIEITMNEDKHLTAQFRQSRIALEDSSGVILTEIGTYILKE